MSSPRTRRHHPIARAGSAAEHLILRHFGFRVIRPGSKQTPSRTEERAPTHREP
jgi:hypothetical protein